MQSYTSIILIVVMVIAFYFLIIRPQRKRSQQQQEMVRKLEPGARVVTTTGIYATIVALGDKQVVLETSPGAQITMLKQAVGRVVGDEEEDAALSSYRGSGTPSATPQGSDAGADAPQQATGEQTGASASGLAGGAPIQEYTPGSQDYTQASQDYSQASQDYSQASQDYSQGGQGNATGDQPSAGPDFSSPSEEPTQHQTAPWPPQGSSEPSGSYSSGSTLGDSSLNAYDEQVRSREDTADGGKPEDDQKQA